MRFNKNIKRLSEEKNNVNLNIKEVFFEAKSIEYDHKIMRKILALSKMDFDKRRNQEILLNTCINALGNNQ